MKELLSIFVLLSFFVSCDINQSNYTWKNGGSESIFNRKFGTNGYDYGWSASDSPFDNGIIIVGTQQPNIGGDRDLWAIKTDNRGVLKWEKTFGGNLNEEGFDVISTSDGGFLFVGYSWSYGNEQQIYAVKTDFHGNLEWEKNYGGGMWDVGNSIIELSGGNFAILGYSNSPGISSGNTDFYLIKINKYGEMIWSKSYGNPSSPNHEWGYDLIELYDKSILMVGARDRYSGGGKNILMIRVDVEGNILWEKEILSEDETDEVAYSITSNGLGSFFISSGVNEKQNLNKYFPRIFKIDSFGNILWERDYLSNSKQFHQFKINNSHDGNVLLVGSSVTKSSFDEITDIFVMKLDNSGNIIWTYPYGTSDNDDWGWFIFEKPDKSIIVVGSTKSFNASLFDTYLFGIEPDGNGF